MTTFPKNQDKLRGTFIGLAVGDALGANLEFTIFDHTDITDDKIAMTDGMWPRGAWTDDTSMALCLGYSLVECGGYDSYDVMDKYRRWVEEGYCAVDQKPAGDVGNQTRAALERYKVDPIIDGYDQRSDNAGNGTIMRLAPVVIATLHESPTQTIKLAQISARETHYSFEAETGAEVFAAMLRQAILQQATDSQSETYLPDHPSMTPAKKQKVLDVARFSTGEVYDDILSRVMNGSERDCKNSLEDLGGYVVDALTIAAWGLRNFDSFEAGMRAVIKLGGDTDTNGAIYGQLAGAYYGYQAIPTSWRQDLLQKDSILQLVEQLSRLKNCPIIRTRFAEDNLN